MRTSTPTTVSFLARLGDRAGVGYGGVGAVMGSIHGAVGWLVRGRSMTWVPTRLGNEGAERLACCVGDGHWGFWLIQTREWLRT